MQLKEEVMKMRNLRLIVILIASIAISMATADAFSVTADSEDTVAAPGNREPNYIVVSVTDTNGAPVSGLAATNFKVDAIIVGPGGALVDISRAVGGRLPGFYLLDVVPIREETWKKGKYIFGISVEKGRERGQALASVVMD